MRFNSPGLGALALNAGPGVVRFVGVVLVGVCGLDDVSGRAALGKEDCLLEAAQVGRAKTGSWLAVVCTLGMVSDADRVCGMLPILPGDSTTGEGVVSDIITGLRFVVSTTREALSSFIRSSWEGGSVAGMVLGGV